MLYQDAVGEESEEVCRILYKGVNFRNKLKHRGGFQKESESQQGSLSGSALEHVVPPSLEDLHSDLPLKMMVRKPLSFFHTREVEHSAPAPLK